MPSVTLGVSSVILLFLGHRHFSKLPISLIVVAASIIIMSCTDLAGKGVAIVGTIPQGLPEFHIPSISLQTIRRLLPLAMAVFLLAYIEGISMARTFAKKHSYEINADQELFALGAANLASRLCQGYPVGGSLSRSAVNDRSGAETQLSAALCAMLLVLVLLFFTKLFTNLPEAVLAAVVIVAVKGLFNLSELQRLYRVRRVEFFNAMVALFGVLVFGLLKGVLIGAVVSLVILVRHVVFAKLVSLRRVRGTDYFMDVSRYPDLEELPGVEVLGVSSRLFYANCHTVKKQVLDILNEKTIPPHLVIINVSASVEIDLMTAEMLGDLKKELLARGICFRISFAAWPVRELLKNIGHDEIYGGIDRSLSVTDILESWQGGQDSFPRAVDGVAAKLSR